MEYKSKKNLIKAAMGLQVNLAQMKLEDGITIIEAESFEEAQAWCLLNTQYLFVEQEIISVDTTDSTSSLN